MSLYILIAILAYLLFAITGIADKFLLSGAIRHPITYAFLVGILSPIVIILAPFGFHIITGQVLFFALLGGFCFTYALFFFYSAIQQGSASRILPIEGGLVPVLTFVLAFFIVGEKLDSNQIVAFVLLVLGSILISIKKVEGKWQPLALRNAIIAAFFFALALTLYKYTYNHTNFISGLIWNRLGLGLGALSFLLLPYSRNIILSSWKEKSSLSKSKNPIVFVGNFLAGSTGSLLQSYAIFLGSVVIVNAMQGVQFVFLLILTTIFSVYFPKILKEDIAKAVLFQKILAIVLISAGLVLLST